MRPNTKQSEKGVALVVTVIVVAMLAVVGVAFMQSTSTDRDASRSSANLMRAKLAADAGAASAMSQLVDLVERYPDSVTVWQNIGGPDRNEATVLYMRALAQNPERGARPAQFGNNDVSILARPLISGATNNLSMSEIGESFPYEPGPTMVDLNATNSSFTNAWIGYRSMGLTNPALVVDESGGPIAAAEWIYIGKNPGPVSETNPAVARFAYWMEDESFRLNVNVCTNGDRTASSLGEGPWEIRADGAFVHVPEISTNGFRAMIDARRRMTNSGFPTAGTAALSLGIDEADVDAFRFMTTRFSAGSDISRAGVRRFNINSVTNGLFGPGETANVRRNLDRIIAAITNTNAAPLFGQRFYRKGNTTSNDVNDTGFVKTSDKQNSDNHALIYLNKIAANVLDYVDADSQPTVVLSYDGFGLRSGRPDLESPATGTNAVFNSGSGGEGTNRYAALGTELRPYLFGYALGVTLTNMTPVGFKSDDGSTDKREADFAFSADHFFDFWNPGQKDIVVGSASGGARSGVVYLSDLFIQAIDPVEWDPNVAGDKDFKVNVPPGTVFPAGSVTLLTTAPLNEARKFAPSAANIVTLSGDGIDQKRLFSGTTTKFVSLKSQNYDFDRFYVVDLKSRVSGQTSLDYQTQVLLGNNFGIVEMFPALTLGSMRLWMSNKPPPTFFTNKTSLFGTKIAAEAFYVSGDPRSLNEPLDLKPWASGGDANPNQYRFFTGAARPLGIPNTTFVNPAVWPDYSSFGPGPNNAPMVVADSNMQSIGELGHLVDSARTPASAGTLSDQRFSRGGGRTLRVGQPEFASWFDGNQLSASRTWTSWRLADVFTTKTNLTIPGLINPNGVLRDNGAALRAALYNFAFLPSPQGDPNTAGKTIKSASDIMMIVTNAIVRFTNNSVPWVPTNTAGFVNPFWERGEISELGVFNASGSGIAGVNMSNIFDRGREEIVRRSIEMMTTRGSIFSVYAIGQSLRVTDSQTNAAAQVRVKTTFEIVPQFDGRATNDGFEVDPASIAARFKPATNYTLRVLSSEYD